jgi:AcrR family transcriptional regulator
MAHDDNTVNIKQTYHHGDLRSALVAAGLRLLAQRDADSLSLREVARAVGVSATAVYRHFPDKDALMAALAREGLARLAQAQREAAAAAGGGGAGFAATGLAYVRFALANPALFRVIFASSAPHSVHGPSGEEPEAGALLRENVAAMAGIDVAAPETTVLAVRSWALVHGLAVLILDGRLPADESLVERAISA